MAKKYQHTMQLLPQIKEKYHVICLHREDYPISVMCTFFGVSRSGYYDFVHRLG